MQADMAPAANARLASKTLSLNIIIEPQFLLYATSGFRSRCRLAVMKPKHPKSKLIPANSINSLEHRGLQETNCMLSLQRCCSVSYG